MIPLKLTLKNFLCYGDAAPTLDLEGLHVVCLCGPNGHGKSALLDAVTWGLWGKARGRTQDELVHFGRDEMLVDLEFSARDARYRVVRRRAVAGGRRRAGASDLQLQVWDGDGFRPITGNVIRGTQAEIDRVTGMDYDTFVNSAFLLQGRADEFTNKTPADRKEVLAKILDLGYYDRLEERAKERRDERAGRARGVQDELDRAGQELAKSGRFRSELETVEMDLRTVASEMKSLRDSRDELKARVLGLQDLSTELQGLRRKIPEIERDIDGLDREARTRQERIDGYRETIARRSEVEEGLDALEKVRVRYEEMTWARDRMDSLSNRSSDLELLIDRERTNLEAEVRQLEGEVGDLRPKAESAPAAEAELRIQRERLDGLAEREREVERGHGRLQALAASSGQLQATAEALKKEGLELKDKLEMVQRSPLDALCPLCGAELGLDGCERLSHNYDEQIRLKRDEYRRNDASLKSSEEERANLEAEMGRLEGWLRSQQKEAQHAVATREREIRDAREASVKLEQTSQALMERRRHLREGRFAVEAREELKALRQEIGNLGYDAGAHQDLYREMQRLDPVREAHALLAEAFKSLPAEEESAQRGRELLCRLREEFRASRERLEARSAELEEIPGLEAALAAREAEVRRLEGRHSELSRLQGELQAQVRRVADLEQQMSAKESLLKSLRDEEGVYRELAEAFGKRGIQAMLIETALPQVEDEANALLGRMTDHRMHVKLETQRQRRTGRGEPIETLEIRISDELGPRSYELFSGGEAFRINLALRIALSKVLAHRKGAPLPTLFIDEGFGTQDAPGRERILDVINAIQRDFEKIIVITHLDDLKDAFQARIEVQKNGDGSTFWISY
ncbi:MAG: SMC family ATPase [Dehalococcoidia bacterium]|nr:SMC family ATPase [Dehalococcoidia bacterium]